jgi:hypothetical protein
LGFYKIADFADVDELLTNICSARAINDVIAASHLVFNDWNNGSLKHSMIPPVEKETVEV